MGDVFEGLFGSDEPEVTYELPPETRELYRLLREQLSKMEAELPTAIPQVREALQELLTKITGWERSYLQELQNILQGTRARALTDYEQIRSMIERETADVKERTIEKAYRDLGVHGLISSKALGQMLAETFKEYELQPKMKALQDYGNILQTLTMALSDEQISFLKSRPEIAKTIADIKERMALTPLQLRQSMVGAITGAGSLTGQAVPIVTPPQPGIITQAMPLVTAWGMTKLLGKLFLK